jgi:uncharacterized protein with HEPN domain
MKDKDLHRLTHLLQSARAILSFVKGKRQASLKNRLLLSAIIREFEIIGEAARMVSEKTKQKTPKNSMETTPRHTQIEFLEII